MAVVDDHHPAVGPPSRAVRPRQRLRQDHPGFAPGDDRGRGRDERAAHRGHARGLGSSSTPRRRVRASPTSSARCRRSWPAWPGSRSTSRRSAATSTTSTGRSSRSSSACGRSSPCRARSRPKRGAVARVPRRREDDAANDRHREALRTRRAGDDRRRWPSSCRPSSSDRSSRVLPGDEISVSNAAAYAVWLELLALAAGTLAFAVAPFLGRGAAVGIAGAVMFAGFFLNGYQQAIPALAPFANLTWFGWTTNHLPLAGQVDWAPLGLVAVVVVVLRGHRRRGVRAA